MTTVGTRTQWMTSYTYNTEPCLGQYNLWHPETCYTVLEGICTLACDHYSHSLQLVLTPAPSHGQVLGIQLLTNTEKSPSCCCSWLVLPTAQILSDNTGFQAFVRQSYTVHVIYNHDKAYPAYLITYRYWFCLAYFLCYIQLLISVTNLPITLIQNLHKQEELLLKPKLFHVENRTGWNYPLYGIYKYCTQLVW